MLLNIKIILGLENTLITCLILYKVNGEQPISNAPQFLRVYFMINKLTLIMAMLGVFAFTSIAYFQGSNLFYFEPYVAIAPLGILFLCGTIVGLLLSLVISEVLNND